MFAKKKLPSKLPEKMLETGNDVGPRELFDDGGNVTPFEAWSVSDLQRIIAGHSWAILESPRRDVVTICRWLIVVVKPSLVINHVFILGGGFKYFLFSPLFGEYSHFD